MKRQRIDYERRRVLRRQALEAGVPWTALDDFETESGPTDPATWGEFGADVPDSPSADVLANELVNERRRRAGR